MALFPFGAFIRLAVFYLFTIFTLVGIGTVIYGLILYIGWFKSTRGITLAFRSPLKIKKMYPGTHIWFKNYHFKRDGGGDPLFVLADLEDALRNIPSNSPLRTELILGRLAVKIGNCQMKTRSSLFFPAEHQYKIIDILDDILVEYQGESMDETGKRDQQKFLISTGKATCFENLTREQKECLIEEMERDTFGMTRVCCPSCGEPLIATGTAFSEVFKKGAGLVYHSFEFVAPEEPYCVNCDKGYEWDPDGTFTGKFLKEAEGEEGEPSGEDVDDN